MRHKFWLALASMFAADRAARVGLLTVGGDIALDFVRQCFNDDGIGSARAANKAG